MSGRIKQLQGKLQYGEYYRSQRENWKQILKHYHDCNKKVVIWGGGLKGTAFLSVVDPCQKYIDAVVDLNSKLHGQRLKTGHPIVAKEYVEREQIDVILVMNELFYVDIYFMLQKQFYTGELIDVDYVIKHNCSVDSVLKNTYHDVDLQDDKLFGYTLEQIHECTLTLLHELDRICQKYNITYFLEAGSALGTYRYRDFVPCDDDIDVAILRKDYEKFLRVAPKELPDTMLIQKMERGRQYPYPYAQLVMDHTCFVRDNFRNLDMHFGLHIDIAPLDNVSDDPKLQQQHFTDAKKITHLIREKMIAEYCEGVCWYKRLIINWQYYLLKFVPLEVLRICQKHIFQRYDKMETGYVGDLCTHYKKTLVFQKAKILPTQKQYFADGYYPVPKDLEYYLSIIYDDYQKLSPRENGSVKYDLVAVSLEKNYREKD